MITKNGFFKIKDVVGVFVGVFLLMIGVEFLMSKIPFFTQMIEDDLSGLGFIMLYLIQTMIFLIPLLLLMVFRKAFSLKDLGFKKIKFRQILKYAALGYLYYFIIVLVIAQISFSYNIEIPGFRQQESHIPLIGESGLGAAIVVLIITLLGPIFEEIFFRGFLFKTMLGRWPTWIAFIVSALIFAAIHLEFQSIIPIFLLGLIMNWMFFRTKSLYPGIFFHIINNAIALGLEYFIYLNPALQLG
ncbi:MAG: type II CAAX endopeptidase family protein [Patescibacteria group bacterium]|nr:CPBP family intramembrane metalloprotease [Patescibacteria group bacterium]